MLSQPQIKVVLDLGVALFLKIRVLREAGSRAHHLLPGVQHLSGLSS